MSLGTEEQLVYKNGQSQQHVGHNRSLASPITGLELRSELHTPIRVRGKLSDHA